MLFLNSILLIGLAGVLIPIILHLIKRQAAKPMDWGAMRFLFDTVAMRRRRMEWEDLLLMATRCLLLALLALAIARPFVPPNSNVPWLVVIPLMLLGFALLGGSFVLSRLRTRIGIRFVALLCLILAAGAIIMERQLNLKRFKLASGRDVALVIDASTSMTLGDGDQTSFAHAILEAQEIVKKAPRGTAFTVVLGGPSPELKTATPLNHRADVLDVLANLQPVGGPFRAQDAIGIATLSLAEGDHGTKEILVFSDGQRLGWRTENPSAWKSLGDAMDALPRPPRLLVRHFAPPKTLRNIAVSGVSLSREVIGTDREVSLFVTLENTGNDTITPGEIELSVEGKQLTPQGVGQLVPGQQETLEFRHQFSKPGPQIVLAQLNLDDDIRADNRYEHIVMVRKRLPVLLIDGQPTGSFFERAAGFTALALAPTGSLVRGESANAQYLMEPQVVPAPDVGSIKEMPDHGVIILADVPRLPAAIADKIKSFVAKGGGLLILTGPRSDSSFYNAWQGTEGRLAPVKLLETTTTTEPISPAAETFDHPALQLFKDTQKSDLDRALISIFRQVDTEKSSRHVAARYSNGEPFLTAKNYGQGRVMLATCRFDSGSGSLPAKQSFVPFIHESVTWLAGAGELRLNLAANWSPTVYLPGEGGLLGEYYKTKEMDSPALMTRVDPIIDYNWGKASPGGKVPDRPFSVRWRGRLLPPSTGTYQFDLNSRGRVKLLINGKAVIAETQQSKSSGKAELKSGEAVELELIYYKSDHDASIQLSWTPPPRPGANQKEKTSSTLVPRSALLPPVNPDDGSDFVLESTEVIDPSGAARMAQLTLGRRGRALEIDGSAIPGLYHLKMPAITAAIFGNSPGSSLPLVVSRNVEESRFTALTADDQAIIGKHLTLINVRNQDDILAVLNGKGFGEEIGKIFAIAALILLVLEVALARWVSKSRRAGEDVIVEFESRNEPNQKFMHAFDQVKGDQS